MITLNEYLHRPIITQELLDIFEEFINSTYNENVLCESLLFEGKGANRTKKRIETVTEFFTSLLSVRRQIIFTLDHLDDIINDNIRKDVKTEYIKYADEYNKFFIDYVKDTKEITPTKLLRTDNKNEIKEEDITKIINAFSKDLYKLVKNVEDKGNIELNEFMDKITEFDYKTEQRIEKSEEKRKAKEFADAMSASAKKDNKLEKILKDYAAAVDEWETKLDNLEEWKNGSGAAEYKEQIAVFNQVKINTIIDIKQGNEKALKNFIKKKNEYCEYISNIIKKLEGEEQTLQNALQKRAEAAAESSEDAAVTPEVQQTAETESDIIKNELVKRVASEVNIDVVALGKLYVQVTKQLSKQNKLTKEMVKSIANTNDNDAIIGLNLMLLGAVTTKNLQNRSKIISEYCSVIQKSIETNNYDKIFDKASKKD